MPASGECSNFVTDSTLIACIGRVFKRFPQTQVLVSSELWPAWPKSGQPGLAKTRVGQLWPAWPKSGQPRAWLAQSLDPTGPGLFGQPAVGRLAGGFRLSSFLVCGYSANLKSEPIRLFTASSNFGTYRVSKSSIIVAIAFLGLRTFWPACSWQVCRRD